MNKLWILMSVLAPIFLSCSEAEVADLIIANAVVYTVSEPYSGDTKSIAVKDGIILEIGDPRDILRFQGTDTELLDAEGQFLMPGFIEGHGHFSGLGMSLIDVNLLNTKSWDEVIDAVADKASITPEGEWIIGRGWHQEKWLQIPEENVLGYPVHDKLSAATPNHPVMLRHASGHGLLANQKAMELAGVDREMTAPEGGEIVRNADGEAIGIFEERAMSIIQDTYNERKSADSEDEEKKWYRAIDLAQKECLRKGITSFQDAGTKFHEADRYFELAENDNLDLRLYLMIRHSSEEMRGKLGNYRRIGVGDELVTSRAIKSEIDGALGSFGAWLLKPYADKVGFEGQNTTEVDEVRAIAELALANDMQLCVHAIGDRANNECLDLFEEMWQGNDADHRWRIEHAQHLNENDIPRFADLGVIASMQGIHCTSDAPFVEKRLGRYRAKTGAYAWRSLLDSGAHLANGTDAPVEDVDPLPSIYASVTRKRLDNGFEFFPEQSMTREEALYSYTMGNAYAAFEEKLKGSIEKGKLADMVILSKNLITCDEEEIPGAEVLYTIVGGEVKYTK